MCSCDHVSLTLQVSSQQEDIKILSSQRDRLQDMLAGDAAKPQMYSAMALLRHARRERDAAVERYARGLSLFSYSLIFQLS